jgi:hypothetical protein
MKEGSLLLASMVFLLGLFFDLEDGGKILLRNVGFSPNYTALELRIPYFFRQ